MDRHAASLGREGAIALRVEAPQLSVVWSAARGPGVTPEQSARIASLTKPFVAAAALRLVERGDLQLDEPVKPLLSAPIATHLAADGYDLDQITVRMLLTHTAGIYDYAEDPAFRASVMESPRRVWTREAQIVFAVDHGAPLGVPGGAYAYSDTGYLLLGDIIERLTGQPLAESLRSLLDLDVHGIAHTWFETLEPEPLGAPPRAPQAIGSVQATDIDPSVDLFGGGGLISTPSDLARFLRLLLRGEILTPQSVQIMIAPTPQSLASGGAYGMGLAQRTVAGVDCYGHGGFWGVIAWVCPSVDIAVTGFTNNTDHIPALAALRDEALQLSLSARRP